MPASKLRTWTLLGRTLLNACANRCYYSAFQGAIVALLNEGLPAPGARWGHRYVQAQFAGQLITRRKTYPAELRDTLAALLELRVRADYRYALVSQREASRAVRRAEVFLDVDQEPLSRSRLLSVRGRGP